MNINFRVEYEDAPIRHIAVQCPYCNKWFRGWDILSSHHMNDLIYSSQIGFASFDCPICKREFSGYNPDNGFELINIDECGESEEVYKGCLTKKEVWE